jgi:hypothetical protein
VQTLLRHSDVKLTLQFYTHAVSRDRMVAAGKMLTAILSHARKLFRMMMARDGVEPPTPAFSVSFNLTLQSGPSFVTTL